MAAAGQRLPAAALEARAGPVVQGDGGLQVEQVGGALEGVPAHGLAVAAERLAQGAALAQPVPRGALGGRRGHAADEVAEDGGALRTGQAQLLEQGRRTELPHGPQGDALDAGAQRRPVPARQGEVTAEVAQGALAHPEAGADEAVGEVGLLALGAGASGGLADEQAPMGAGPGAGVRELQVAMALHLGFPEAGH